jgi:predicted ABC-type sugar transport system permease subunit
MARCTSALSWLLLAGESGVVSALRVYDACERGVDHPDAVAAIVVGGGTEVKYGDCMGAVAQVPRV